MCGGSSGGDGGAAERKAKEDARQQDAIANLNKSFGVKSERAILQPTPADLQAQRARISAQIGPGPQHYRGGGGYGGDDYEAPTLVEGYDPTYEAKIQAAIDAENAKMTSPLFSDDDIDAQHQARENLYGKFAQDAKALQLDDLNRDRGLAERDVSFDLARRGLTGGSRQIDVGRDMKDQFDRGVLTADNNAQDVANRARQGDEKTRVSLINGIRGGMGEADAVSAALNGMRNTADQAASEAKSQNVGGFFDAIRSAANSQAEQSSYQKAFEKYKAGGGSSGGGSYGGSTQTV